MSVQSMSDEIIRRVASRLGYEPKRPVIPPASPPPPPVPAPPAKIKTEAEKAVDLLKQTRWLRIGELKVLDRMLDGPEGLAIAKAIVDHVGSRPDCASLVSASEIVVGSNKDSRSAKLVFMAGNYVTGRADRCIETARELVAQWPSEFTHVLLARCLDQAESAAAEFDALQAGLLAYPDSRVLRLNLAENLIGTDQVDAANAAVRPIMDAVREELAEEIEIGTRNQADLDEAIASRAFAPEGDGDIYSDDFCRAYWHSYFESYVSRSENYHGDRLLLTRFVQWVDSMKDEIDVVLDFGCLCAQPLYEAAELAPNVKIIGTDRQEFLADMNRLAYPIENVAFDAGDIFEVMERTAKLPGRKAFSHVRTTCTLYPEFVDQVYAAAARLGYEHIYLLENAGFVRSQLRFMPFRGMNAEAVVTKHRLVYHNYHNLLTKHGYNIEAMNRIRAPGIWRGDAVANLLGSQIEVHARLG